MKKIHGIARELAIDEQLNKLALLEKAGKEWGLEDSGTIELYIMQKSCTYADMVAYYNLYNAALTEDFGFGA